MGLIQKSAGLGFESDIASNPSSGRTMYMNDDEWGYL